LAQSKSDHPNGTATFVSNAEIGEVLLPAPSSAVADNVLRVVPINGEYNVGVSVVRRVKVNGRTPPDAILHHDITEIYHVLKGSGILVTGGSIEGETELPSDDSDVRTLIGPSTVGKVITGGTRQRVGPGDIVISFPRIPPTASSRLRRRRLRTCLFVSIRTAYLRGTIATHNGCSNSLSNWMPGNGHPRRAGLGQDRRLLGTTSCDTVKFDWNGSSGAINRAAGGQDCVKTLFQGAVCRRRRIKKAGR
jgi:hypothetical protein